MSAKHLEVLFTPAEFDRLGQRDLSETQCVVLDVLRATSSMVTALGNGAAIIIPVAEIAEALAWRQRDRRILLAGERHGVRIEAEMTGESPFDFGNSPREFTAELVGGKTIAMTTTNGTRALRACRHARSVVIASFINLRATVKYLGGSNFPNLLLVCGGTYEEAAYEDILCAGAIVDLLTGKTAEFADSALAACKLYRLERHNLRAALSQSRNGRRLLERPDLRDDVAFCATLDQTTVVAGLDKESRIVTIMK
jgi:2-phosphosulfolactate phosphatase